MRFTKAKSCIVLMENGTNRPFKKGDKLLSNELKFDSRAEMWQYLEFSQMQREGKISNLMLQVPFLLIPKRIWYHNLKEKSVVIREVTYIADFVFVRQSQTIVADCKGWRFKQNKKSKMEWQAYIDDDYKIKKKMFLHKYPEYTFEEY